MFFEYWRHKQTLRKYLIRFVVTGKDRTPLDWVFSVSDQSNEKLTRIIKAKTSTS